MAHLEAVAATAEAKVAAVAVAVGVATAAAWAAVTVVKAAREVEEVVEVEADMADPIQGIATCACPRTCCYTRGTAHTSTRTLRARRPC